MSKDTEFMFDKPLPKGMHLPDPELEPEEGMQVSISPMTLTHSDVNYSALIRQALGSIQSVDIAVKAMSIDEADDFLPVVRIELVVFPKE